MATAEELRRQIDVARRGFEDDKRQRAQANHEVEEAKERQRLRRVLDDINELRRYEQAAISYKRDERSLIDRDLIGDMPINGRTHPLQRIQHESSKDSKDGELNVITTIREGEYVWKLKGMSWLQSAMAQNGDETVCTPDFMAGSTPFDLVYAILPVPIDDEETQVGSLAIRHRAPAGIIFRYRIFIKSTSRGFVQWGQEGDECHPNWDAENKAFGPDVQPNPVEGGRDSLQSFGIFGLTHDDLVKSEWVEDDTLTVKVQVEVMEDSDTSCVNQSGINPTVDVPAPDMASNLISMLDSDRHTDITFAVDGQHVKAHSQIVSARSEFFDTMLNSGMQESTSKVIEVRGVDAVSFGIFLRFLYTDDLERVDAMINGKVAEETVKVSPDTGGEGDAAEASTGRRLCLRDAAESSGSPAESSRQADVAINPRTSILQNILSVSHQYQVQRLRLWCEQQLCMYVSKDQVCSLLCQAHLYEARQLERACLTFIKKNQEAVVATSSFGSLCAEWPEIMLKINIFLADLSESSASSAVEAHKEVRTKRSSQLCDVKELETTSAKRKRNE